jgi:hypothetical protein
LSFVEFVVRNCCAVYQSWPSMPAALAEPTAHRPSAMTPAVIRRADRRLQVACGRLVLRGIVFHRLNAENFIVTPKVDSRERCRCFECDRPIQRTGCARHSLNVVLRFGAVKLDPPMETRWRPQALADFSARPESRPPQPGLAGGTSFATSLLKAIFASL